MNNQKVSAESDDDEVLNKLDALLYRYKNQVEETDNLDEASSSIQDPTFISVAALLRTDPLFDDAIPTLTEVVLLQSATIQTHTERSLTLQQVLDAALEEVNIEMSASDRAMLTKALVKRLFRV